MGCLECDQLWRQYARRTTDHMQILGAYDQAVREGERELARVLGGSAREAERLRGEARHELTQHESGAHGWTWASPGAVEGLANRRHV